MAFYHTTGCQHSGTVTTSGFICNAEQLPLSYADYRYQLVKLYDVIPYDAVHLTYAEKLTAETKYNRKK